MTVGHLDAHRTGHQHRALRYHLHPGAGHGLSARITTSSSSRQPRGNRPVSSSQSARADSTGPNGIHWEAMISASSPEARNESSDSSTPASAEWTSNREPPRHNRFDADAHSGSSTSRPSGPAFQAHAGPALGE